MLLSKIDRGEVLLLDNVRMFAEETLNKTSVEHSHSFFVKSLAPLDDVYINDVSPWYTDRTHLWLASVYILSGVKPEEVIDIIDITLKRKE